MSPKLPKYWILKLDFAKISYIKWDVAMMKELYVMIYVIKTPCIALKTFEQLWSKQSQAKFIAKNIARSATLYVKNLLKLLLFQLWSVDWVWWC